MSGDFLKNLSLKGLSRDTRQVLSAFTGLAILVLFFSLNTTTFFTKGNILSVALQTAVITIIAIAQTYVIITTGIDLSIGSTIGLGGINACWAMAQGMPWPVAVGVGLLTGMLVGFFNGAVIVYGNLPPFIVTLGSMSIIRGFALVLTGGIPISGLPKSFTWFGTGKLFDVIPVPVVIMVVLALVFGFVLAKTRFGRYVYAVGSNHEAARLSGVNTRRTLIMVYVISGFLGACAGLIQAARIVSGQPNAGMGYELDSVAASVIGGASLMGGEGTIAATVIGAFIIGVLRNGLNLMNVSPFWQQIVIGFVIIGTVYLDRMKKK